MSAFFQFAHRVWQIASPPAGPPKNPDALKFGILGAAKIAPNALISPAAQHADVIVQAVAARDKTKATAFAKKHGIPQVFDSYTDLLSDPSIPCIFIPLPNALHYEWALKALSLGKHVLVEKPSTSNATEATLLFHSPLLLNPNPPIILEAFHYKFHPAWTLFTSLLDRPNILHAKVNMFVPGGLLFPADDIRFDYALSGGALMDETYTSSVLRGVFGAEPEECLSCEVVRYNELCDGGFDATFRFPGGGTGEMHGSLVGGVVQMLRDRFSVEVAHRGVVVDDGEGDLLPADQEVVRTRSVKMYNFLMPVLWHRIDIEDTFVVRRKTESGDGMGEVVRTWKVVEVRKAYTFCEAGVEENSEAYWTTYKYQLDAFVDRVRGREVPSGVWVDGEDSIGTMRMVDMAYEKSGLPVRPTSGFRLALDGSDMWEDRVS